MYKNSIKPVLDTVISFILILFLSPLLILVMILLIFQNKGNPFFTQIRPGKNQIAFRIIKFKTMTDEKDKDGNLLPDVERMTKLGRIIRKLSIDELPQLFNVLKGDMSLVGPRPLLFKYIPLYSSEQLKRHNVKPGITGWAQVNGRNSISWNRKFELDIEYVSNCNFNFDFKIFLLTVKKVLKREGINQSENRPMLPFDGTN